LEETELAGAAVPGVVVHHTAASTRTYLTCPSIVVLVSGDYLVSLGRLGQGAVTHDTFLFSSCDRGLTWQPLAHIRNQVWSTLFVHGKLCTCSAPTMPTDITAD
jgi:hypothetical protein